MIQDAVRSLILMIRKVEPNTKFSPGDPFTEIEKLPGIVVEGPKIRENKLWSANHHFQFKKDLVAQTFEKRRGGKYFDLDFNIALISQKETDLLRMIQGLIELIASHIEVEFESNGNTYQCLLSWQSDFSNVGRSNLQAIHESNAILRIEMVPIISIEPVATGALISSIAIELNFTDKEG